MNGLRQYACVTLTAAALTFQGAAPAAAPAQNAPPPAPAASVNQVESVTLAEGVKQASLFGTGLVTPIDPTTTFAGTDLPYAIIRMKALVPGTTVALQLKDRAGAGYTVEAKIPSHPGGGNIKTFDFAAPLYILGTDLETDTGTWHLQILVNGQPEHDTTFQWDRAQPSVLLQIKNAVDQSPLSADLHWRYGAALALFGQTDAAINQLQNAIRLDANYALYYITLGRVYEHEGRQADAVQQFQKALTLHGSSYDAVFSAWARAHLDRLRTQ